jgi:hypothetical protein
MAEESFRRKLTAFWSGHGAGSSRLMVEEETVISFWVADGDVAGLMRKPAIK